MLLNAETYSSVLNAYRVVGRDTLKFPGAFLSSKENVQSVCKCYRLVLLIHCERNLYVNLHFYSFITL